MVSSTRQAIGCILFSLGVFVSSQSQIVPPKSPTAVISGKVTVKDKGIPGIVVVARRSRYTGGRAFGHRGTTDQTGNYRITNLPAGSYEVIPATQSFVSQDEQQPTRSFMLTDGETIEDVNFTLAPGGVITGRVTDADGRPLIEEPVFLSPVDDRSGTIRIGYYGGGGILTDDRGVYRAFGLRPGKYQVSVGQAENQTGPGVRMTYKQTFHPAVNDPSKATVIEVTEGSEMRNVDIVVGGAVTTFKVTGRIVDGETGKPLPNIRYGLIRKMDEGGSHSSSSGAVSNSNGEFKFESVLPGNYSVFIVPTENSEARAEAVPFEVVDRDLTGLLVKTSRGASLAGVVVLEGSDDKIFSNNHSRLHVSALVETSMHEYGMNHPSVVNADGSFKLAGLRSGVVHFSLQSWYNQPSSKRLAIIRIERDGVVQPLGINLKEGEQITGLRLVVKYHTGAIRGQVKLENGELPPSSYVWVNVNRVDDNLLTRSSVSTSSSPSPQVDSRGRFVVEGLAAGTYEVGAGVVLVRGNLHQTYQPSKQLVTVYDDAVSEVFITLKTEAGPGGP